MNPFSKVGQLFARYRPRIGTAFLTYMDLPAASHEQALSDRYEARIIESGTDPLLKAIAPPWRQKLAAKYLDAGDWYAMAILDGDQVVGRVWMATRVDNQLLNGIMHVRLRDDEAYGFDLYIEPEHRRGSISSFIADACISELQRRGTRIGYTHLMFDNPPSVMWHHMVGFNWLQVYNMISIGERFVMKIPFSESPRFGPLSRRGRHSEEPPPDPFGGALIPH